MLELRPVYTATGMPIDAGQRVTLGTVQDLNIFAAD
jgi:hypothetical protein